MVITHCADVSYYDLPSTYRGKQVPTEAPSRKSSRGLVAWQHRPSAEIRLHLNSSLIAWNVDNGRHAAGCRASWVCGVPGSPRRGTRLERGEVTRKNGVPRSPAYLVFQLARMISGSVRGALLLRPVSHLRQRLSDRLSATTSSAGPTIRCRVNCLPAGRNDLRRDRSGRCA